MHSLSFFLEKKNKKKKKKKKTNYLLPHTQVLSFCLTMRSLYIEETGVKNNRISPIIFFSYSRKKWAWSS